MLLVLNNSYRSTPESCTLIAHFWHVRNSHSPGRIYAYLFHGMSFAVIFSSVSWHHLLAYLFNDYALFLPRDALAYSAKRGLAIACRPSVCLSVCDVDGLWTQRLEILETNCTNNYPNIFALCSQKAIHLLPGEHGEILWRLEVGQGKVACWRTKAAISMKCVKMEDKVTMEGL